MMQVEGVASMCHPINDGVNTSMILPQPPTPSLSHNDGVDILNTS